MSFRNYPSVKYIRQRLRYEDGKLYWLTRPRRHFKGDRFWKNWNNRFAGKEAGYNSQGRIIVTVDYVMILGHHIVWALHHGHWRLSLDHKNRNSLDNRIENLRACTQGQNNANRRTQSNNRSGLKGASLHKKSGLWLARIGVKGEKKVLGYFRTPEEAHAAYIEAAWEYYGEFAHDGT